MKPYPEKHQKGLISISNKSDILNRENDFDESIRGDFGVQIAKDGRVWICINGISFIRFSPIPKETKKNG